MVFLRLSFNGDCRRARLSMPAQPAGSILEEMENRHLPLLPQILHDLIHKSSETRPVFKLGAPVRR
jgi:hypothetical protein